MWLYSRPYHIYIYSRYAICIIRIWCPRLQNVYETRVSIYIYKPVFFLSSQSVPPRITCRCALRCGFWGSVASLYFARVVCQVSNQIISITYVYVCVIRDYVTLLLLEDWWLLTIIISPREPRNNRSFCLYCVVFFVLVLAHATCDVSTAHSTTLIWAARESFNFRF